MNCFSESVARWMYREKVKAIYDMSIELKFKDNWKISYWSTHGTFDPVLISPPDNKYLVGLRRKAEADYLIEFEKFKKHLRGEW